MLGDNPKSRIEQLSDRSDACFKVIFDDNTRESLTSIREEFSAMKGVTARGKRVTTFEVKQIEDITPEPVYADVSDEPAEVASADEAEGSATENTIAAPEKLDEEAPAEIIENGVAFTIEASIPDDSKPVASEPDGQMSLF